MPVRRIQNRAPIRTHHPHSTPASKSPASFEKPTWGFVSVAGEEGRFFDFPLAFIGFYRYPRTTNMAKALSKSQIVTSLAETVGLTKKQAVQTLEALVALAYKNAKNSFTIPGLGKIVLVNRKARMGRNPATGETIKIAAKRVVKFRVAKAAKDAILGAKK
jgi:DNA-binding protein HU-beta